MLLNDLTCEIIHQYGTKQGVDFCTSYGLEMKFYLTTDDGNTRQLSEPVN